MRESAPCLGLYFFARAEVVCKADGRVRRFVGLHGINKETADGDVDDDGVHFTRSTAARAQGAYVLIGAAPIAPLFAAPHGML